MLEAGDCETAGRGRVRVTQRAVCAGDDEHVGAHRADRGAPAMRGTEDDPEIGRHDVERVVEPHAPEPSRRGRVGPGMITYTDTGNTRQIDSGR
jgi:hypothetical protein